MFGNNHIYIITNFNRTTLYIGVTSNLCVRLGQHADGKSKFSNRYKCKFLVYYEHYPQMVEAINREKQLKRWSRKKKEKLIATKNPLWVFLNDQFE
ncbi:MAG: GIY-YIG nuclease family protein [Bacteroidetes bacterium]|nr:GIY-YIG nuclease family protein [Bacteroidota bacterium]